MPLNTWIKLRSGILEPKHRERLGIRIWLYLYMLDRVDWETGTIEDWRDKDASEELQMPTKTITRQRQEIADAGYITCRQSLHCQVISITNWQDPRSRLLDEESHGTQKCVPSDHGTHKRVSYGTHKRVPYGPRKVSTIYLNPHIKRHILNSTGAKKKPAKKQAPAPAASQPTNNQSVMVGVLSKVTGLDYNIRTNAGRLAKRSSELIKAGYFPAFIEKHYGIGGWWYLNDWRGKNNSPPTPEQILETVGQIRNGREQDGQGSYSFEEFQELRRKAGKNE